MIHHAFTNSPQYFSLISFCFSASVRSFFPSSNLALAASAALVAAQAAPFAAPATAPAAPATAPAAPAAAPATAPKPSFPRNSSHFFPASPEKLSKLQSHAKNAHIAPPIFANVQLLSSTAFESAAPACTTFPVWTASPIAAAAFPHLASASFAAFCAASGRSSSLS